ncbi:MAG: GumC family protein [Gemmatimonadaceae bacterium]
MPTPRLPGGLLLGAPDEGDEGIPWSRITASIRRYKWLILAISAAGLTLGVFVSRTVRPEYEARGTLWISTTSDREVDHGPIRAQELMNSTGWTELMRSYAISDAVVRELGLYLWLYLPSDSTAFQGFKLADPMRPGHYILQTNAAASRYVLTDEKQVVLERGALGDSIGHALGFLWKPTAEALGANRKIRFQVVTPRQASIELANGFSASLPEKGNLMRVTLRGGTPRRLATILNTWMNEFVSAAARLKKDNLSQLAEILHDQLTVSERQLRAAELALEDFRVHTITLPSEGGPVAAGVEMTRNPVLTNFFTNRIEYDNARRDREALERILRASGSGAVSPIALQSVPSVLQNADNLRLALTELSTKEAQLRSARQFYTDQHKTVRDLEDAVNTLERQTIPSLARDALEQLRQREQDLSERIGGASRELEKIPARTIEEMRLRRDVVVSENLYTTLQSRYAEARLAEASAIPDLRVLDSAVAPVQPSSNAGARIPLIAALASVGLALGLAILLDRFDPRLRYANQVSRELGLDVITYVPRTSTKVRGPESLKKAAQLAEAFRALRLHVTHMVPPDTAITMTVTSPAPQEGKSLIASNLALAFSGAGLRTILIDGDIRRGTLHSTFDRPQSPGLTDYLAGEVDLSSVLHHLQASNLSLVPRGTARAGGPELLTSRKLPQLIGELRNSYDVVIVDGAPLSAGMDSLALSIVTGNALIVLRSGLTDKKLAASQLRLLQRLPITPLGAVLNDANGEGDYQYYSYGYSDGSEPDGELIGERIGVTSAR